ncbi:uncharacterized protein LOC134230875 [Saccostrea cucullata]|uniref:uncharacterized protein LOC134230875 n=1 Tax=Saccostrea cuccullata TaxID=36930 RepID=UPI002ED36939
MYFVILKMDKDSMLEIIVLLYLSNAVHLYAAIDGNAICFDDKNNTKCCMNYVYKSEEDRCIECVGGLGEDCSEPCPDGFYGDSCRRKCNCSYNTCHQVWGCLGGTWSNKDGVCYDKWIGLFCCANYMYVESEHRCQECVGWFGANCSSKCPDGFYGKQCIEKCSCEARHCDKVLGCLSDTSVVQSNERRKLERAFPYALSALLSVVVLLVLIALGMAYRLKRKHIEISKASNSTQDDNGQRGTGTSDVYATVLHPIKKPLRGIQQNDMTYDNTLIPETSNQEYGRSNTLQSSTSFIYKEKQTLRDLNTPYSMCIGLEDDYNDTVCIPSSSDSQRENIGIQSSSVDSYDVTLYDDIDIEGDCVDQRETYGTENQLHHTIDAWNAIGKQDSNQETARRKGKLNVFSGALLKRFRRAASSDDDGEEAKDPNESSLESPKRRGKLNVYVDALLKRVRRAPPHNDEDPNKPTEDYFAMRMSMAPPKDNVHHFTGCDEEDEDDIEEEEDISSMDRPPEQNGCIPKDLLYRNLQQTLLLLGCYQISSETNMNMNDTGLCITKKKAECCTNYKLISGKCIHCLGSFGKNCTQPCPYEYYGYGCSKKCKCTWNKFCDPKQGCQTVYNTMIPAVTGGVVLTVVLYSLSLVLYSKSKAYTFTTMIYDNITQLKKLDHSSKTFKRGYEEPDNNLNEYSQANISQSGEAYDRTHCFKDGGILGGDVNNTKCCTNYLYNAEEDQCIECVGRFGENCSEPCPHGYYGASCKSQCNCSSETCHKIWGCLEECVGRFGINCSRECPRGYYGRQCNEKCSCDAIHCDNVRGCLLPTTVVQKNERRELEKHFPVVLFTSLSAAVLLVLIVLGIAYRFKNKHIEIPNANNSTQDDNEATGYSDIYAAVIRPKRKPVRGIQQNDMTYDNTLIPETSNQEYGGSNTLQSSCSFIYKEKQTLRDLNSPYSVCIGLEDAYGDTVCIPSSSDSQRENVGIDHSSVDSYDVTVYDDIDIEGDGVDQTERYETENQIHHNIDA